MNKTAIKNFAVWARVTLINAVTQMAFEYDVTETGKNDAAQESVNGRTLTPTEKSQRAQLISNIRMNGFAQTMEEAAYTWFNRFIALRFMEVNNYLPSHTRIFSDESGAFKPEILNDAVNVDIDGIDRELVLELLENQENERLYKYLLITQCNALNEGLPEMFEQIGGWTELLFPPNLLRQDSVIAHMVCDIPEDDWRDQVQIIGWLYQYYNTEQNELVYDGTMLKAKIPKELISAATTMYTPDWAVRYMVDNSLGKLLLKNYPDSEIKQRLKYYIETEIQIDEKKSLTEIKFLDPCMGSGHILVYAFDVFMDFYVLNGYSEKEAAELIIENNLYGLELSKRAYQLAYFAVFMKARQYNRKIIKEYHKINLTYFEDLNIRTDFLSGDLQEYSLLFQYADVYGSLLSVKTDIDGEKLVDDYVSNLTIKKEELQHMVDVYNVVSEKYDVIVTNPPYLGSSRFNAKLSDHVNSKYAEEKSDLSMAMFRHCLDNLSKENGLVAFITTSSWFFLSSFEKLRNHVISNYQFDTIVDYGTELFEGKVGHNPIVSWVTHKKKPYEDITAIRLVDYCYSRRDEKEPEFFNERNRYTAKQENFSKIPGMPVAYWVSEAFVRAFENKSIGDISECAAGITTGDNDKYLKLWHEIIFSEIAKHINSDNDFKHSHFKYAFCNKGGNFRRWYGNNEYVALWIKSDDFHRNGATYRHLLFKEGMTWSEITSGPISTRYYPKGLIFDHKSPGLFADSNKLYYLVGLCNTKYAKVVLNLINPTISLGADSLRKLPAIYEQEKENTVIILVKENINLSKQDWDSFETSWNFDGHPLI